MGSGKNGSAKNSGKRKRGKKRSLAEQANKFDLYQKSVQSADHEVEFFERAFRDVFRRKPFSLREDFCGTFSVCCEWVKSNKRRTAVAVDLCGETLQWGSENNLAALKPSQQERVRILEQDVRKRNRPQVDVLAAQNFSFWIFKTRSEVVQYFKAARANLCAEGVMVLDMMGGGDCYVEDQTDKRTIRKGKKKNRFRYHWEQASFNPITRDVSCYITFKFKDGSRLNRAFEYHWRFWTIPEVREMLAEAGFSRCDVYWEVEDEDGEDTGEYEQTEVAESWPCWVCYLVAVK